MLPEDLDPPDPRVGILTWLVVGLLVAGFGACIAKGANNPSDPELGESRLPGFGEIGIRIVPAATATGLTPTEECALLAATEKQRARGLMEVTDLKGYPGMVFRYPADSTGAYYMRNTPTPLSIAWFAADGSFVSSADMAPCEDRSDCPTYGATGPYRVAFEVPQGDLAALGIGPGSKLEVTGACPRT
ncbi:MAG TPA: DUF192 domain-containing protein [Acidimicrobiales bacterium]|nr:DUF192 domain-containing protein [Acidimicrobiales bacterium]